MKSVYNSSVVDAKQESGDHFVFWYAAQLSSLVVEDSFGGGDAIKSAVVRVGSVPRVSALPLQHKLVPIVLRISAPSSNQVHN
jgi:hypothetical protein